MLFIAFGIKTLILVEEKKNKITSNKNQYIQTFIKINNILWKIQFIQLKVLTFRFHCTDGPDGLFLIEICFCYSVVNRCFIIKEILFSKKY